jgi:hypothetical protein
MHIPETNIPEGRREGREKPEKGFCGLGVGWGDGDKMNCTPKKIKGALPSGTQSLVTLHWGPFSASLIFMLWCCLAVFPEALQYQSEICWYLRRPKKKKAFNRLQLSMSSKALRCEGLPLGTLEYIQGRKTQIS